MNDINNLKKLVREDGYLYTCDVVKSGYRKELLKKSVDQGILLKEARGIYSFSDSLVDEFVLYQIKCKKGIYSYGTALYFHGMSDRFPNYISMTIPNTYNVYYLQKEFKHIEFHRILPQLWNLGVESITSPQGGIIHIYNKERCICDLIRHKKNTDPQVFSQAMKEYFSIKTEDLNRLMEYAKLFDIEKKVYDYMEVLL